MKLRFIIWFARRPQELSVLALPRCQMSELPFRLAAEALNQVRGVFLASQTEG